jgi:hypothetical protein
MTELLAAKMKKHGSRVWPVNSRIELRRLRRRQAHQVFVYRAIFDAIHSGALSRAKTQRTRSSDSRC